MNSAEIILWEKIKTFRFNDPDIDFTFEQRLERENGWTKEYTLRVIEEYKKFIFLCCITETGVTPSDPVDQAWHLHLTFTKSYWVDLCKNTLEKEIHHNPTKGGQKENEKFNNYYTWLFELYRKTFNEDPPDDIWHDNKKRFSDIDFQRVNRKEYWLVKRPSPFFKRIFFITGIALFASLFIQAVNGIIFPLALIVILFIVIVKNRKSNNNRNGCSGGGCSVSGCGGDGHSHSGCGSGCSGSSGCGGGCGGGGD